MAAITSAMVKELRERTSAGMMDCKKALVESDGDMVPRLYRVKFHRDIYKDLDALQKAMGGSDEKASTLDTFSLELFENISYVMARHADPSIPDTPEEWLEQFNTFSIYQVLPEIIELWGLNVQTDVTTKKNFAQLSAQ